MADGQLGFSFDQAPGAPPDDALARDRAAREYAVDPAMHVALEASAGTGKTKVLVDRYVNLIRIGVEPRRVLALTFTRKAAAEMRARIVAELTRMAEIGAMPPEVWKTLRGRLSEVAISTIDAFCLSLLGEFPLEADVDPGFGVADETETPRLMDEALDRSLRIGRGHSAHDGEVGLLFARLGEGRLRGALARLLDRRLVALDALDRFLGRAGAGLTSATVAARGAARVRQLVDEERLMRFVATGPDAEDFRLLASLLGRVVTAGDAADPAVVAEALARLRDYACTRGGTARKRPAHLKASFPNQTAYRTHAALVAEIGEAVPAIVEAQRREVNVLAARGLRWLAARAFEQYRRTLDEHAMVDFTDALTKAIALLAQMEEFSQSRYRLESRYQHVLVDELQDTSRPQWALVELLVRAWSEGVGVAYDGPAPPSIFVVGDRKQSIYGFRDAEVGVMEEAAKLVGRLRQGRDGRRAIVQSFRAVPALQRFVNDVCDEIDKRTDRVDAFRYSDIDRFPVVGDDARQQPVGLAAGPDTGWCARAVAGEIRRLLDEGATVRDRDTGVARAMAPGDVAILFRSRDSHREFERALEALGVPFYVYKGLGFFDADEVKDVLALIAYLAEPASDRCAAAFLRSRLVRLSDPALTSLAPHVARALSSPEPPARLSSLDHDDRTVLEMARAAAARWIALADRLPPAELVDLALTETAYDVELAGAGRAQARENLKKLRGLVRRLQNRGYATLARISSRLSQLMAGDESNAIVDAADAVNLMTVHAAKGLEFPVVFVVNLSRGAGGSGDTVEVVTNRSLDGEVDDLVSIDGLAGEVRDEIEAREREESKRLVYVALTRARDRLYLATALAKGQTFAPSASSLGQVLPASFGVALGRAGTAGEPVVEWHAASGAVHTCRVVVPREAAAPAAAEALTTPPPDDFAPLVFADRAPLAASDVAREGAPVPPDTSGIARDEARSWGALLHRAVARGALRATGERRAALLEALTGGAPATERARLAAAIDTLAGRDDLQFLISERDVQHEVAVSWREGGTTIRAIVDALVRHADGTVTVVELKSGVARDADERQLALYVEAIRRLAPGVSVRGRIVRLDA